MAILQTTLRPAAPSSCPAPFLLMPGLDRASFPLRHAAPNSLTTNPFPEGESAKFADSLSSYQLSINHLAAARNLPFVISVKYLGVSGLSDNCRPGTPAILFPYFNGQGLISWWGPCPLEAPGWPKCGQGVAPEIRPCPSEGVLRGVRAPK